MISNLLKKLKGFGEESMILVGSTQAKCKAVGPDEMVNNLQEKIKQVYFPLENMASSFVGWFGEVVLPGLRNGSMMGNLQEKLKGTGEKGMIMMNSTLAKLKAMGADEMMNNLQEKLKQQFLLLKKFGLFLQGWLEEVFPPEHWLRVNAPFLVTAGLVLLVLYAYFSRSGGGTKPSNSKTMKAPGRNSRIFRAPFEDNPKGYFRDLHASKRKNTRRD